MAVEETPRLGLTQWTAPDYSDPVHVDQFNGDNQILEDLVAGWLAPSTAATRPAAAPGNARMMHRATDTSELAYSTGQAWISIIDRRATFRQALTPQPITEVQLVAAAAAPRPIDHALGYLWARPAGGGLDVVRSDDMGRTWSGPIFTAPASPRGLLACDDGEVLLLCEDKGAAGGLYRSSGFAADPSTATWDKVVGPAGGPDAQMLRFGVSGNGTKFIAAEYAEPLGGDLGNGWEDSRYVWISTDQGITWNVAYDTRSEWPDVADYGSSHLHGVAYDPWMDRFWWTEGHGTPHGIYFSDDDGATFQPFDSDFLPEPAPTVMIPTDDGIVCGTDSRPAGVYVIRRTADPADLQLAPAWEWPAGEDGLYGWCYHGHRDPDTGIVYLGYRADRTGEPTIITASNGITAGRVWQAPEDQFDPPQVLDRVLAADGRLAANLIQSTGDQRLLAVTGPMGAPNLYDLDPGKVLGGVALPGGPSGTEAGSYALAIGRGAEAHKTHSIAISPYDGRATENFAIAIGRQVAASAVDATAVGRDAEASASDTVAIGRSAQASKLESIAIGLLAVADGDYGIAIGKSAQVDAAGGNEQGIAIGIESTATGVRTVAVGRYAAATNSRATAIGPNAAAPAADSTALGHAASAAGAGATAVGYFANAAGPQAFAAGQQASAAGSQAIAIGRQASVDAANSIAIGYLADIGSSGESVAIGRQAVVGDALSGQPVALGYSAQALHGSSVALGSTAATTQANQVMIGNRDLESTRAGGSLFLRSANGSRWRVQVNDAGNLIVSAA